jgi:hypothetical protein
MEVAENHHPERNRPTSRLGARLLGPAVLALLVIGFFWKLALSDEFLWVDSPDLAYQVLPWFQFQATEWHAGRFPLWDPYVAFGQPLLGQGQPGAAYPLNWLLFLLPLRDGWLRLSFVDWYFVGCHILAAWLAYWLCRDRSLGRWAAVGGGLAFSLSGWLGTVTWPQMLNGAIWAPAVFLFLFRINEGRRPIASSLLAGFFLGLSWLSGHHQAPIFLSLASVLLLVCFLIRNSRTRFKTLVCSFIVLISLGLTSGLQTLPAIEYGRLAVRWAGMPEPTRWGEKLPYMVHQNNSLTPISLLGIAIPGVPQHVNPFVGVTILTLAIVGVIGWWKEAWARLLVLVSALGFLTALGTYSPLHGLLYALVPLVEKARSPGTSIFIFNFGIAILSACGIEYLLNSGAGLARRAGGILLKLGAVLFGVGLAAHLFQKDALVQNEWITVLAALSTGCLLTAYGRQAIGRAGLLAGLASVVLTELTVGGLIAGLPSRHEPGRLHAVDALEAAPDLVAFLKKQPGLFRLNISDKDLPPFNFGDWHGIETTTHYLASIPANVYDSAPHELVMQQLAGARYYLAKSPQRPEQRLLFEDPGGLKLFENPDVFPRAWSVHNTFVAHNRLEVMGFILNKKDQLASTAPILDSRLPLEQCATSDQVRVVEHHPGRTVLDVELGCRGLVVLSDVYFPGWFASVDRRRTPIHEAYGFMRAVVVEAGRHHIDMVYRPRSVYAGGAMTAAGAILALAAALAGLRERKV